MYCLEVHEHLIKWNMYFERQKILLSTFLYLSQNAVGNYPFIPELPLNTIDASEPIFQNTRFQENVNSQLRL